MAELYKLVPHIIKWEVGADPQARSTNASKQKWLDQIRDVHKRASSGWTDDLARELFLIARTRGYANDPVDTGGATMVGVTIGTYSEYRRRKGLSKPTVAMLKDIKYEEWLDILKTFFWNPFKADQIRSQSIAKICVDWYWGSGKYAIKNTQQCLGLVNDGIVGSKTLAALNSDDPSSVFKKIWKKRRDYYYGICARRADRKKFLNGWLNRLNDCKYEE